MSDDFDVKILDSPNGPLLGIRQTSNMVQNMFSGQGGNEYVQLTAYEAEKLIKELTDVTRQVRNGLNRKAQKSRGWV